MFKIGTHRILNDVYEKVSLVNHELAKIWYAEILFSWRWWLSIALTIVPWILWIRFHDKKNTIRLLFTGLVVTIVTNVWDTAGIALNLWHYDWKVFPVIPAYIPWDFALFPISVMFFLQVKPKTNIFLKALIYAIIGAFIFEPMFNWIGLYDKLSWKHSYSFIIYFFLYLFYNFIYTRKKLKTCSS